LHIFHQEEGNEESAKIREVEEEIVEEREGEDTSEEKFKVNNTSQIRASTSTPGSS
jgi:hypothetical protein